MKKSEPFEQRTSLLMLGYLCASTSKDENLTSKVQILDRFGLTDDEIASICNCKPQSVRDARQKIKKIKK